MCEAEFRILKVREEIVQTRVAGKRLRDRKRMTQDGVTNHQNIGASSAQARMISAHSSNPHATTHSREGKLNYTGH